MIRHEPEGIEDPYKPAPVERIPRQPRPADAVQINFQTDPGATCARVGVDGPQGSRQIEASALGRGQWLALIPAVHSGTYRYSLSCSGAAGAESAGPYAFEVGSWQQVTRVAGIGQVAAGVLLELESEQGRAATLEVGPSGPDSLRLVFRPGPQQDSAGAGSGLQVTRDQQLLLLEAAGIEAELDTEELLLRFRAAGSGHWQGRLPLAFRWLEAADGQVIGLEAPLSLAVDESLHGLGERFGAPDLRGRRLDVRVYEEYREQGDR